jgi:hypothetical protein
LFRSREGTVERRFSAASCVSFKTEPASAGGTLSRLHHQGPQRPDKNAWNNHSDELPTIPM